MKFMKSALIIIIALGILPGQMRVSDFILDEVVITAQYSPQSVQNSIYRVTVIPGDEIRQRGVNSLDEILTQELNINIQEYTNFGAGLEIEGLSKENIKIFIDSVPVVGRVDGILDLGQIDLNNVKQIEIIRGPTSVFYGTDALAGVVNIITNNFYQGGVSSDAKIYLESVGIQNYKSTLRVNRKNNSFILSGSRNFRSGFSKNEDTRVQDWKPKNQTSLEFQYARPLSALTLSYSTRYFREKLTDLGAIDEDTNLATDTYRNTTRFSHVLSLKGNLLSGHYINLNASFSKFERKNLGWTQNIADGLQTFSPVNSDTTHISSTVFRLEASRKISDKFEYLAGSELTFQDGGGSRISEGSQTVEDYAIFASMKYGMSETVIIQPGIRYNYNSDFVSPVTPSVNIMFKPASDWVIRGSLARGFRAPTLKELYLDMTLSYGPVTYNIVGNENLKAEESRNVHISLVRQTEDNSFEISAFYNDLKNMISRSRDADNPFRYMYVNVANHYTHGISARYQTDVRSNFSVDLGASLTGRNNPRLVKYPEAEQELWIQNNYVYTPEFTFTGKYRFSKAMNMGVYYKFTGIRPDYYFDTSNDGQLYITSVNDAYSTLDLTFSRSFNTGIVLTGGVKNLFDNYRITRLAGSGEKAHLADVVDYGRTVFLSLEYKYTK